MSSILSKKYIVTMANGQKWSVPVERIAHDRALYYAQNNGISFDESLKEDTLPLFDSDEFEVEGWAKNNMNWSDVAHYAELVCDGGGDLQDGWVNGEVDIKK